MNAKRIWILVSTLILLNPALVGGLIACVENDAVNELQYEYVVKGIYVNEWLLEISGRALFYAFIYTSSIYIYT